ncbi:hypothetical protein [Streptomyces coeruleorubidus]
MSLTLEIVDVPVPGMELEFTEPDDQEPAGPLGVTALFRPHGVESHSGVR